MASFSFSGEVELWWFLWIKINHGCVEDEMARFGAATREREEGLKMEDEFLREKWAWEERGEREQKEGNNFAMAGSDAFGLRRVGNIEDSFWAMCMPRKEASIESLMEYQCLMDNNEGIWNSNLTISVVKTEFSRS